MIQLITAVGSIASQWLSNKAEKSKAIQAKELELIEQGGDWEALHAQGSQSSWKDEWFTVLFSIPLIMCFIPPLVIMLNRALQYWRLCLIGTKVS